MVLEIAFGIVLGFFLLVACFWLFGLIVNPEFWKIIAQLFMLGLCLLFIFFMITDKGFSSAIGNIFGLVVVIGANALQAFFLYDAIKHHDKHSVLALIISLLFWLSCIFTSATFLLALISTFVAMGIYLKNNPVKERGAHEQN